MPNYSYWKISWQTDLAHWLDYNLLKEIRKTIKQEVRLFPNGKTILYLYLKSPTNKQKISCIFTRAESIQESNKQEFEEARNIYFSGKKRRDEIYNLETNFEREEDSSAEKEEKIRPSLTSGILTPIRIKREESPFSINKKVKVEISSPPSINISTTNSAEEERSRSISMISVTPPEQKKEFKKEDIVLKILNGESIANIVSWCKSTKNVRLFMLIHENYKEFHSMEALIKALDYDGRHNYNPNLKKLFSEL